MSKGNESNPTWIPDWFPKKDTIDYISGGLTALLLILVGSYLALHFFRGKLGITSRGATIAAGVGVGGAGT